MLYCDQNSYICNIFIERSVVGSGACVTPSKQWLNMIIMITALYQINMQRWAFIVLVHKNNFSKYTYRSAIGFYSFLLHQLIVESINTAFTIILVQLKWGLNPRFIQGGNIVKYTI